MAHPEVVDEFPHLKVGALADQLGDPVGGQLGGLSQVGQAKMRLFKVLGQARGAHHLIEFRRPGSHQREFVVAVKLNRPVGGENQNDARVHQQAEAHHVAQGGEDFVNARAQFEDGDQHQGPQEAVEQVKKFPVLVFGKSEALNAVVLELKVHQRRQDRRGKDFVHHRPRAELAGVVHAELKQPHREPVGGGYARVDRQIPEQQGHHYQRKRGAQTLEATGGLGRGEVDGQGHGVEELKKDHSQRHRAVGCGQFGPRDDDQGRSRKIQKDLKNQGAVAHGVAQPHDPKCTHHGHHADQ